MSAHAATQVANVQAVHQVAVQAAAASTSDSAAQTFQRALQHVESAVQASAAAESVALQTPMQQVLVVPDARQLSSAAVQASIVLSEQVARIDSSVAAMPQSVPSATQTAALTHVLHQVGR